MAFYRKVRIRVSFDLYRKADNKFLERFEKEIDYEEDPLYESKEEAYRIDGTLDEWAEKVGKALALEIAAHQTGVDAPEDLEITELIGTTFIAKNVKGEVIIPEEGVVPVVIPAAIRGLIELMIRRIKEAETLDEKMAIRDEAIALLLRYGISREEGLEIVKIE